MKDEDEEEKEEEEQEASVRVLNRVNKRTPRSTHYLFSSLMDPTVCLRCILFIHLFLDGGARKITEGAVRGEEEERRSRKSSSRREAQERSY